MKPMQWRLRKKRVPADVLFPGFWTAAGRPLLAAALLAVCLAPAAQAQTATWPAKPIKIVVPYPPGSSPDLMGRLLAQSFQATLKQTVVVDNKAGALGIIGTQEVARSAPDGYTLLLTTNTTQAANVALVKDLQYDPIKDFAAISLLATAPMMLLVPADSPIRNVDELVRQGRAAGKGLSAGYGSAASQVSTAKLRFAGKLNIVDVPYKGIPLAVNDMLGGQLAFTFADLPLALPLLRSGRAKGLGVTSLQRVAADPQIPALAETFPGFEVTGWQGLVAPAGTPDAVIEKLHDAVKKALAEPQNVERMKSLSFTPSTFTAKQFSGFIVQEVAKWKEDAKQAGMTPQ
ncbi:MAG: hypothetical protein HYX42_16270 [Polaromonas sp.]|uniref:Bug family tripartite tricarboxylate transporter substrate binding protein n=1 Tax=Polaromonas sp. TaxID=1869339 RepID=UPI0025E36215|nr:tripartite tricarboxylate transporter substrate-binding protein [Polaromonas sp.]MBI2727798.1 hypothetical protein [Polaromonas sp.]